MIAALSLGKDYLGSSKNEKKSLIFRRSIYIVKNVKKGEKLNNKNIKIIRPGNGLHPKYFKKLIGKKFKKTISEGTPLEKIYFNNIKFSMTDKETT